MLGQGRALRGEGVEALETAIVNLKDKSHQCFKYFMLELLFFHISSFLLMWIYYTFIVAFVINLILMAFLLLFIKNGYDILKELYVDENEAVSGKFQTFSNTWVDIDRQKRKGYQEFQDEQEMGRSRVL